jgi:hypothetical protein
MFDVIHNSNNNNDNSDANNDDDDDDDDDDTLGRLDARAEYKMKGKSGLLAIKHRVLVVINNSLMVREG